MLHHIQSTVKGHYTVYNAKTMEVLADIDNVITDIGMDHLSTENFAHNIQYIGIGTGTTTEDVTDTWLEAQVPVADVTSVVFAPFTGTDKSILTDGRLSMKFTRGQWFTIKNNSYTISEIIAGRTGCNTCNQSDYAFSRVVIAGIDCIPLDELIVKYTVEYITNANIVQSNIPFDASTHPDAIPLPSNQTNVRQIPISPILNTGVVKFPVDKWNLRWSQNIPLPLPLEALMPTTRTLNGNVVQNAVPRLVFGNAGVSAIVSTTVSNETVFDDSYAPYYWSGTRVPFNEGIGFIKPRSRAFYKKTGDTGDTWEVILRFLAWPGQMPTCKQFILLNVLEEKFYAPVSTSSCYSRSGELDQGILTNFPAGYNPRQKNLDMFVGIDYKFTWTRI